LDVHLDVATWLPTVVDVSGRDTSEAEHAAAHITPGAIHVYDRGVFSFDLVTKQQACGAFFVHRLREPGARSPQFIAREERVLSAEDRAAGVVSDRVGRLAGSSHRTAPDIDLREIIITSPDEPGRLVRLLTNLWDQPAWVIALIYRYRWQVELFFRWLKVSTNFRHLISESRAGILMSFYVALIGVLLQCAHTGTKLNKYAYNLLGMVAAGQAELDDILPIVAERNRQIELDKASLARRRAKKHA
jgi:transposase